ncbi:uncharacterized protein LOC114474630 [Gouania willdenowi]|uniref:uncharacterized protein LOC114474630 n=1 Tax=Gouania willdenowi TaxID=441366 RepID=UPI001055BBAD|nr:uncharacterized protein LOC114474630 [Gouania willdenowi]
MGYYCVGGVAVPCPAGTYSTKKGLQRPTDCTICPAGFYCLEGSSQTPSSQFLCPPGYYCEEGTVIPHGTPCPAGTAGEQLGQTSRTACKRCREGRFCPAGSSGPGLPCARGSYCPAGTTEEVICPSGTFTTHQGAKSVKDCLKCPAGFYCPEGTSDPVPCPPGSFNPLEGQDEVADCRECYAGKACTQVALTVPDVDCMQGFVCPPGSSKPNAPTNACPPGTLSNRTDLTDRSQCQLCPPRYACLRGTGGVQRPPLLCFAGHYCPPGTMLPTQFKCPVGTWSSHSGLEGEHECQPCPQGWYCLAGSGAPSGRCSSGHYCPEGTAYSTQFACPVGTYSIRMGNRNKKDCFICPEGFFCEQGTSKPSPCPPSTYHLRKGGQRLEECSPCPAGYFCPHSATVNPRVCGAGSYSDEGSVECAPCLQGHYCSNETTSEEAMLSVMVCPPGFLCSQGLARDPQRSATLCPLGFYCPGGSINPNPIPCPNGTFGDNPGLRAVTECIKCPEGEYCYSQEPQEHPIAKPTGLCPDGHFCPRGTGHPFTHPCQAGRYRNNSLGHSGESCILCPPQYFCDTLGTSIPSTCPQGYYCPEGTSAPNACPEGTYGSSAALSDESECILCDGGRYCNGVGLTEPTGSCKERFYCRYGAKSATPVDGPSGGLCPSGGYCPPGSSSPRPCPSGTFSNSTGLSSEDECVSCPPGFYCSGSNNTSPSGPCWPGFYCTGASASPVQNEAEAGYYTLEGAARATPCPLGTFQPDPGAMSCVKCQGGTLCNQTGMSQPSLCPSGHYCPPESSIPRPCPPGSYTEQTGGESVQHCRPCEAGSFCSRAGQSKPEGLCDSGHYCSSGASTPSPVEVASGGVCPAGYFCPQGTKYSQQYPCPIGTWSNMIGAQNLSSCQACPPALYCNTSGLSQPSGMCDKGFYCSGGAVSNRPTDGVTGDICSVGHYCLMGSSSPVICPDGTFSNSTGAEVCDDCPSGTYCLSGEGVQPCPAGHYCVGGGVEGILPCPPGTYSPQIGLSQVEQCLICPAGFYCEDWGLFEPTGPCQAGFYCIAGVNFPNPDGNFSTGLGGACPKGRYCPEGTSIPLLCPPGTYSNNFYLTDAFGCNSCPAGHYCGSAGLSHPSGLCQAGVYCPGGDTVGTGSEGGICPTAHYCPEASSTAVPCPAGTYTNLTGQSECSLCPAGYYCPERTRNFTEFPCPAGFYCPDGTRYATQFPCPRGYYNPEPMTQSLDSCLPCPPGYYCEKERLTKVSGKCKAGWFCVSAAWTSQPFDLDNYTNANCLCPATSTGGRCQVGFYCPTGSSEPIPCPPGAFCNTSGLAEPVGPCASGFFCTGGATVARPIDGDTGNICPPGTFCVAGSVQPELCPAGTVSSVQGLPSEAGCQPCTAGFYCSEAGLRAPTGLCSKGYWCPSGQSVATALSCPTGHFCLEGSSEPEPCPSGTYQDKQKQASCSVCEQGYYCNVSSPMPCPKGHYCPAGTSLPHQHPCPKGSFNPSLHASNATSCMPCTVGHYCPAFGLSEPAGLCEAGYWCTEGASSPSPLDGLSGSLCPPGHFCPKGTTSPEACPAGSWSESLGLKSAEDCKPCLGGFYCDSAGLTKPSGLCSAGYYCRQGAITSAPTDGATGGPCPEGHYCPVGTFQPVPCDPGTYVAVTGATYCETCVAGWHCVSGSLFLCPAGFYCPEGTGFDLKSCPEGSYGPDPGYWSVSQCKECDGGHYCSSKNGTAVTGPCREGYYCSRGNISPQPHSQAAGEGGACPKGHYCPQATIRPLPCPRGTFSNLSKLMAKEDCRPCTPGYYCDSEGLSAPSGKCWRGFYCSGGADRPDPPLRSSHGGPCPKGHYCAEGSVAPQRCPMGTISVEERQASCNACPHGFYCPIQSNDSLLDTYECPVGYYCPSGTWSKHQYPCPAGTINPHTHMAKPEDCLPCPSGQTSSTANEYESSGGFYCDSPGKSVPSGLCDAGHYCRSGAWSPTPEDGGLTGDSCPVGHYCPQGSSGPLPCLKGYYSNRTGNSHLSDCLPCPPGFLCATRGLSFPSHICPAGSYCPGIINSSLQESIPCTPGNRCPAGTDRQIPCLSGTYQSLSGQADCVKCPAGFYCAGSVDADTGGLSGTQTPIQCPKGHFCPTGTQTGVAYPCPAGTFSKQMGLSNNSGCELCPPGRYCSSSGLSAPTGVCSPGYLCIHGSVSAQPDEGPMGGRCSAGSYCPNGTSYMIPCPVGTFSSTDGASSIESCQPCFPGHFCAKAGLSSPSGPCSPGFYCTAGSKTPIPWANISGDSSSPSPLFDDSTFGQFHGDVCPAGHFCQRGSVKPSPCPPGTLFGSIGAQAKDDCEACYPGFYCPAWAQTSADLLCPPGWFCPARSTSGQQPGHQCPPGYACPRGSSEPIICSPGAYQSESRASTCRDCPPGFYCIKGSSTPFPCPVGHFSPSTGRSSLSDCSPCPPGSFCNSSALIQPSGPCTPGHFCSLGSIEHSPVSKPYGDVCPMGHFCPQGGGLPKPCPVGSFLPEPGAFSLSQCIPCPPGKYCLHPGAAQPTGLCSAGFFCSGNARSPTPQAEPSWLSCLIETLQNQTVKTDSTLWMENLSCFSSSAISMSDTSWIAGVLMPQADSERIVTCMAAPLKTPNTTCFTYSGDICPKGFYCPMGSAYPQLCEAGSFCNRTGLGTPSGLCAAGYYCPRGSSEPHQTPCPKGHYCPFRTPVPLPCPPGTIKSSVGGATVEACQPCPPGYFCHQGGGVETSGQCAKGYYCPEGQSSQTPQQHICSVGHYCEKGSVRQTPCSPSSYQSTTGQGSCETCPAGFFCQDQGMTQPLPCGRGFYCPSGSANQHPCPSGSYGNVSQLVEEWQCSPCDPGMYCEGVGRTAPGGLCAAGFVCVGGASDPSPSGDSTGFVCPPGFFCPVGTSVPKPCPKGTFSEQHGLVDRSQCRLCTPGFYCSGMGLNKVSGPCLPGFFCLEGSQSATPMSDKFGSVCPAGHYCAEGSVVPAPCPAGTYQNKTGGKGKDDCKPCPFGYFQDLSGQNKCSPCPPGYLCLSLNPSPTRGSFVGVSSPLPCPPGFICPRESPDHLPLPCPKGSYSSSPGLSSIGQCVACPAGHFCGSEALISPSGTCAAGFLCLTGAIVPNPTDNKTGSLCPPGSFCQKGLRAGECRAGFYCDWGSSRADRALCPAGFFCPRGTSAPIPCPAGSFSPETGNTNQNNCTICAAGYYCDGEDTVQPALCPVGHYCPAGLSYGMKFPCPLGTVQSQRGVSSLDGCLPCPAGSFCSESGLVKPSGMCEAGFYCPAGSTSPNSTEYQMNSSTGYLCPFGHYCPAGTGYPLPCPVGSLSVFQGLKAAGDCTPCPPGLFCDKPSMAKVSEASPCQAGYVCLGGSSIPTPSDGLHGYRCPAGHSCPVGSATEVPCEPGTYSPVPGAAQCITCPKGTMCSSLATQVPSTCPVGKYCPTGIADPLPCPFGTFSNRTGADSLSTCTPCPSGVYCSSTGASAPQGPCLQGYFCQAGATEPTPQSSDNFPRNGLCPVGHYCPEGCLSPIPCPAGSIRNTTGGVSMESCTSCPAGQYCSTEGLSNPTGHCAAGFTCPFDFSSTTPFAFLCPKGYFCPRGAALPLPCPTGEYQPNSGSDSCIPCRPGFYCEEAIEGEPRPCPPHSFCPAGTKVPQPCPKGTYTYSEQEGLQEEGQCLPCPPGKFCRAGRIQGACAAGYLCVAGSADFMPQSEISNMNQCQWGVPCAGPCPPGSYCPEGTKEPHFCPENTFRNSSGGASTQDCLPCPSGYWCKAGDPIITLCPDGYYCTDILFSDHDETSGPRPCPLYTYRASPGAKNKADCLPCPPGSHCNSTGLTDFSSSLCPPGFWCSGSGPPIFCPAGTKRPLSGAAAPNQCEPCAGGTFCPDPRDTGIPNVEGIPCRASYYCPVGAVSEILCSAGSYCGPGTAEPQICPEGYYCPVGSQFYNHSKQLCLFPYYCPANSFTMKLCEGGSMPVNTNGVRGFQNTSCSLCEVGTYRPYLSPNLECDPCPSGYYCPRGTDNYKKHPCPIGYVCPTGSNHPISCPPGSFGNFTNGEKISDCHSCPVNTFNHLPAQRACFPCGSSSTSPSGSSSCTCIGQNRAFQYSDGSCLCRTGFIFYNQLDFKRATADSKLDCQPEVNKRCSTGEVRLAASRECVSPTRHSCNITCSPSGGTLDVEMGICQCEQYVSAEELCNTSCLSRLPQLSTQLTAEEKLLLVVKENDKEVWARTMIHVLGPDVHAKTFGKTHLVLFSSEGVFGFIPTKKDLIAKFLSEPRARTKRDTEEEEEEEEEEILPLIPNPIACLTTGDMLLFHLTINHNDRHSSHFPVYVKDHLFNSNPSWDFGAFRNLQTLIKQTNLNSTLFAHVFSEPGKYVFVDNAFSQRSLVVVVCDEDTVCDHRAAVFQPMTSAQLVKHGIVKQHKLNLLPDWGVIAGVLSTLLLAVILLTSTFLVLRPGKTKLVSQCKIKPKWRSLGEPFCPMECVCSRERGVGEGAEAEEPSIKKGGYCNLEEFNVKTLYDKLEDQNLHVASQLAHHRKDIQEFYRNMCQQTESLKNVLETMDHKKMNLLKDLLCHKVMKDKLFNTSVEERDAQDASTSLMGAVLQSVEALLYRLSQDSWQNQDLFQCEISPPDECTPQFPSPMKTALPTHGTELNQSTIPSLTDHDLSKLITISPLHETLKLIQTSLENLTKSDLQNAASEDLDQCNNDQRLVPVALDDLPPQHSAVFLFGCQVMQLLVNCPLFPPVLLLLAKSIPSSSLSCNESLLVHCSRDFYFDATNQILYLPEAKLHHVGHFIAILVQSMAHIASGSKPQRFIQALHEAISALSLQLFNLSIQCSTAESIPKASDDQHRSLGDEFLHIRFPFETSFTEHTLASRLEKFRYFKLEQLISIIEQRTSQKNETGLPPKVTSMQVSCIEEEIDRLNELFLLLSMQLQGRAQISTLLKERESADEKPSLRANATSMSSLSRNGTILLELKRSYVSQRLDELHTMLGQIRQRQQHNNKWKDETRGFPQAESSTSPQETWKCYSGQKGANVNPADGQRVDSVSQSQDRRQFTIESRGLSDC